MNGAQSNARRILFASWHWYLDQSNGASITTRETLLALARRGWDVKTFCGAATDFFTPSSVDEILTSSGVAVKKRFDGGVGEGAFRAVATGGNGVFTTLRRNVAPSIARRRLDLRRLSVRRRHAETRETKRRENGRLAS